MNDLDESNAKLAYTIIQSLMDSHEALSDLLVVMSHALDEDVLKALTGTNEWQAYLDSKRNLEITRAQIERLTDQFRALENSGTVNSDQLPVASQEKTEN
jgi:hypothetical protein